MAFEPTVTITGNLTADPELRYVPSGSALSSFTIASTPRSKNAAGEWVDGETWFVRCSAWRDLAENIAASLQRGHAVVATGRLTSRTYEPAEGGKRTVIEMTVDDLGPSMRRATAKVVKTTRERPADQGTAPSAPPAEDPWAAGGQPATSHDGTGVFSDEPPF
jgi:single-strand DNA-binding protein